MIEVDSVIPVAKLQSRAGPGELAFAGVDPAARPAQTETGREDGDSLPAPFVIHVPSDFHFHRAETQISTQRPAAQTAPAFEAFEAEAKEVPEAESTTGATVPSNAVDGEVPVEAASSDLPCP